MSEGYTQTEPMIEFTCNGVDDYEGICFMVVKRMDDFIRESTGHAVLCGMPLVLVERSAKLKRWRILRFLRRIGFKQ